MSRRLSNDIFQGSSLSQAMSKQPESFPLSYVQVVRTGELGGRLSACLNRLATDLERQNRLNKLLFQILIYPVTLLLVSALMMAFGVYGIFPMIVKVSVDAGSELPWLTRVLLAVSSPKVVGGVLAVVTVVGLALTAVLRHPRYAGPAREFWETFSPLGRFQVETRLVLCIRQLSLMMDCGIDLLRSLRLLEEMSRGCLLLEVAFGRLQAWVREGHALHEGLAQYPVFPGFLSSMVAAGEETASIGVLLDRTASVMEEDLERRANNLASLAEPLMIGFLGLGVGIILIATLMPIYQMVNL